MKNIPRQKWNLELPQYSINYPQAGRITRSTGSGNYPVQPCTDAKKFTADFFINVSALGDYIFMDNDNTGDGNVEWLFMTVAGAIFYQLTISGTTYGVQSAAGVISINTWHHIHYEYDSTLAVAADRIKIFVDGVNVNNSAYGIYPTLNLETTLPTSNRQSFGSASTGPTFGFVGLAWRPIFIDGATVPVNAFADGSTPLPVTVGTGNRGYFYPQVDADNLGWDIGTANLDGFLATLTSANQSSSTPL